MKLKVSEDELYPIYDIGDGFGREVEVSEEFFKEFTEVMDKFWNMQIELEELYRTAPDEKSPYTFGTMPEFTCDEVEKDEVDERGLLIFKAKDRYNFSLEGDCRAFNNEEALTGFLTSEGKQLTFKGEKI